MNLPAEHQTVMPYLILKGASQFIDFTKNVFGASETHSKAVREDGTIMHAEITLNGSTIMVTDETEDWSKQTANLFVYVLNADKTYLKALENGAVSLMGLSDQDYGRTCGVTDPFGNVWWITSVN
ncbi:VOC family protein [Flavobacterium sp. WLB]|uniref:VOC family protein n=1 Tax=Flavobacterium TaxID=237 RepID=UPI0006ABE6AA|nr:MULTISPECIES: VOC family protein [Flavobacterium]KOP35707.1 glyoxalase [Flavobacterium sp. VMW]OWU92108.1 glyoxalase [Flavobacterium sp. NLM]PUU68745.1 VOC family protein [Flavobacterium sp. WLB]UUF13776.1 VOC family protein [Flavobacterium panici]